MKTHLKNQNNRPTQYQKGWVEFYKLRFKLTEDVLIPRPETELLVDDVLTFAKNCSLYPIPCTLTILDIGTGSGNIAISLACNLKGCIVNIIATDVSKKALIIAKQNAKLHGVEDKIDFLESDLLNDEVINVIASKAKQSSQETSLIKIATGSSSLRNDGIGNTLIIVTNLPYIPSARIPYLDESVTDFEPHVALDGGEDGFELYRKLFFQIKEKGLKPNLILGEIDYTHGEIATSESEKYFPDAKVEVKTDLAHKQRILTIQPY